jgi:hydroxylamine reductase
MTEKQKITKEMSFAEIMEKNPKASEILLKKGMHCVGCPMSQMESLNDGCISHGLDPEKVAKELNK